jgi:hypothetical protein
MLLSELKWERREPEGDSLHFMRATVGDRIYIEYQIDRPDEYYIVELNSAKALQEWLQRNYDISTALNYWDRVDALTAQCLIHSLLEEARNAA